MTSKFIKGHNYEQALKALKSLFTILTALNIYKLYLLNKILPLDFNNLNNQAILKEEKGNYNINITTPFFPVSFLYIMWCAFLRRRVN